MRWRRGKGGYPSRRRYAYYWSRRGRWQYEMSHVFLLSESSSRTSIRKAFNSFYCILLCDNNRVSVGEYCFQFFLLYSPHHKAPRASMDPPFNSFYCIPQYTCSRSSLVHRVSFQFFLLYSRRSNNQPSNPGSRRAFNSFYCILGPTDTESLIRWMSFQFFLLYSLHYWLH